MVENDSARVIMAKSAENAVIETMDVTALVKRPRHLEAIGTLTVEITHMERAMSELFGVIMGIHFFLGEAIYFTVNSGIARMDIVRNAAAMVLCSLPDDLKKVNKFVERAKAAMGKRHAVIHSFWRLAENGEDIRREKLGEFRRDRVAVVSLTELKKQIEGVQKITNEVYSYCHAFREAHPKDTGTLATYWTPTRSHPRSTK
jgi:hypothetical protein